MNTTGIKMFCFYRQNVNDFIQIWGFLLYPYPIITLNLDRTDNKIKVYTLHFIFDLLEEFC